jgi:transposase
MQAVPNTIACDDADALRAALASIAKTSDADALIEVVITLLLRLSNENKRLHLRLSKALRGLHGRKSEKLSADQLELFRALLTGEPAPKADTSTASDSDEDADKKKGGRKGRRHKHGRGKLPDDLPRIDNVITVPEQERICAVCGATKQCIGHDVSERLDYVPASLRVIRDLREKVACKPCQGEVNVAPAVPKIVEGGLATEGLLAHVLVSKYVDGLPLTRLNKIFARSGVHLAPSTLGDFVRQASDALRSVARHIEAQVLQAHCINQDDTGLRVLDRDHPKGIKQGHIWAYVGGPWVAYRYTPNWRGEHPKAFLAGYAGVIQGDGYSGIDGLFDGPDSVATRAGCMMHCRRYFFDAHKAGDTRAGIPLVWIHDLYKIERHAKDHGLSAEDRGRLRQQESLPLMAKLKAWIDATRGQAPPKTPLGKAITYATNKWGTLLVPFNDGRLEIDNGEAERRLRLLATGRKNWLFAGSDKGGERAATVLTVLGTALVQGVNPQAYLTAVLGRIAAGWPASRIAALMPLAWAQEAGQQAKAQQPSIPRLVT